MPSSQTPLARGMTRRAFLGLTASSALATSAAGLGLFNYIYELEPYNLTVEHLTLTLPRLPAAFNGMRLVQISDLHIRMHITDDYLNSVIDRVNSFNPDVVAITGDYVHHDSGYLAERLIPILQRIQAREAVVGVMGNHDLWANIQHMREVVAASNVHDLRNDVLTIYRGADTLHFSGVESYSERRSKLGDVLNRLPETGGSILLVHEPDFADISAATGRFDLQISGHSHGGQVRLPGIGALILPSEARKYPKGHYLVDSMHLYTNRGIGMTSVPVRLNCPPEVTVFTLQSA